MAGEGRPSTTYGAPRRMKRRGWPAFAGHDGGGRGPDLGACGGRSCAQDATDRIDHRDTIRHVGADHHRIGGSQHVGEAVEFLRQFVERQRAIGRRVQVAMGRVPRLLPFQEHNLVPTRRQSDQECAIRRGVAIAPRRTENSAPETPPACSVPLCRHLPLARQQGAEQRIHFIGAPLVGMVRQHPPQCAFADRARGFRPQLRQMRRDIGPVARHQHFLVRAQELRRYPPMRR